LASVALGQALNVTDVVNVDDRAGLSCYFWTNWALYDLTKLTKETDYNSGSAYWNYCAYASLPAGNIYSVEDTYAFLLSSGVNSTKALPFTDSSVVYDETDNSAANTTSNFTGSVTYT
jgi:hypothetical protein